VREGLGQRGQVGEVIGAVGQVDVEVAALLGEREVAGGVDREGEHAGVASEDRRGAVALVDVGA